VSVGSVEPVTTRSSSLDQEVLSAGSRSIRRTEKHPQNLCDLDR